MPLSMSDLRKTDAISAPGNSPPPVQSRLCASFANFPAANSTVNGPINNNRPSRRRYIRHFAIGFRSRFLVHLAKARAAFYDEADSVFFGYDSVPSAPQKIIRSGLRPANEH